MKKFFSIFICLNLIGCSRVLRAEDLLQIYKQARLNNPEIHKSAVDRDATIEKINEAESLLLPRLNFNVNYTFNDSYTNTNRFNANIIDTSLQLTQTIFDMSKWNALNLQEKAANIKNITYHSDEQMLILNTAQAYFNVLSKIDALSCIRAEEKTTCRQLDQTVQRFKVGLASIADIQNAKAQYNKVLANEITVRNHLANSIEALRYITGNYYTELASLNSENFKIDKLKPIDFLLKEAEKNSLTLLQARLNQDLARAQIRQMEYRHLPVLELFASVNINNTTYNNLKIKNIQYIDNNIRQNKVVLSLSLPIYQGGIIDSKVKQARYEFIDASEKLENTYRNTVQTVRSSFNNIKSSVRSIDAYKQVVTSAQSSLDAMESGYSVGTRTIIDVMHATTSLYEAKQHLLGARYNYLINLLTIKSALGALNEKDLVDLNRILKKPVSTLPDNILFEKFKRYSDVTDSHDVNAMSVSS